MNRTILAAAAATLLASTAAHAADLLLMQPEPMAYSSPTFSWTGFYLGANAGYGWGVVDTSIAGAPNYDAKGFVGGVHGGYNYDLGGFVIGAEADFSFSDVNYTEVFGGVTSSLKLENFGSIRARVGLPVDRFLPYVTGGFAYGTGSANASAGAISISDKQTHTGWTVGAGAEYALTDNAIIRAEYLYTDLGTKNYLGAFAAGGVDSKVTFSQLRVGVSYKF